VKIAREKLTLVEKLSAEKRFPNANRRMQQMDNLGAMRELFVSRRVEPWTWNATVSSRVDVFGYTHTWFHQP